MLKEPRRGSLVVGDYNYARGSTPVERATVADIREYLGTVNPQAEVWKGHGLGPKAMRTYGFLLASPTPVMPKDIRDELSIGRKRAVDLLNELADRGLAQRPPGATSGWIAGPLTPADLAPDTTPAPKTPQRPTESQLEPSMPQCPDHHDGPRPDCPFCHTQAPVPNGTPAPVNHVEQRPASTQRDLPWGWDIKGQEITGPNGTDDVWRLNGSNLDWLDGHTGEVRRESVDYRGAPPAVWAAYQRIT